MRNTKIFFITFSLLIASHNCAMETISSSDNTNLSGALTQFYRSIEEEVSERAIPEQIRQADDSDDIGAIFNSQKYTALIRTKRASYSNTANSSRQQQEQKPPAASSSNSVNNDCKLCPQVQDPTQDRDNFVLDRLGDAMAMFNRFPYKAMQLLFLCKSHVPLFKDLTTSEQENVNQLTKKCKKRLTQVCGFNDFACLSNEGHPCTGGTITGHWHRHLFPKYDSSRAIERPLAISLPQAERSSLYDEFLHLFQSGNSEKLKKVYSAYGKALQVAEKRDQNGTLSEALLDPTNPIWRYQLASAQNWKLFYNPESPFLGEVLFIFADGTSQDDLNEESSQLLNKNISAVQEALLTMNSQKKLVFDGFSTSEVKRGGRSVFIVRPRKAPQISTHTIEDSEIVTSGDPEAVFDELKKVFNN